MGKKLLTITVGTLVSVILCYSIIDLINQSKPNSIDDKVEYTEQQAYDTPLVIESFDEELTFESMIIDAPSETTASFTEVFSSTAISKDVEKQMVGVSYHDGAIDLYDLRYLTLTYVDFDGNDQIGNMIVHRIVANDVIDMFKQLYKAKYPIYSIKPVYMFEGDDDLSMAANNTSAFNYRNIGGLDRLSNHAYGLAIDINPLNNPYIVDGHVLPEGAKAYTDRTNLQIGMVIKNDICYTVFKDKEWTWGGDWTSLKDYQHFEIEIEGINK